MESATLSIIRSRSVIGTSIPQARLPVNAEKDNKNDNTGKPQDAQNNYDWQGKDNNTDNDTSYKGDANHRLD